MSAARECAADVIVIGSRNRSWFSKLIFGSTTDAVLGDSDLPVFVVPADEEEDGQVVAGGQSRQ